MRTVVAAAVGGCLAAVGLGVIRVCFEERAARLEV